MSVVKHILGSPYRAPLDNGNNSQFFLTLGYVSNWKGQSELPYLFFSKCTTSVMDGNFLLHQNASQTAPRTYRSQRLVVYSVVSASDFQTNRRKQSSSRWVLERRSPKSELATRYAMLFVLIFLFLFSYSIPVSWQCLGGLIRGQQRLLNFWAAGRRLRRPL